MKQPRTKTKRSPFFSVYCIPRAGGAADAAAGPGRGVRRVPVARHDAARRRHVRQAGALAGATPAARRRRLSGRGQADAARRKVLIIFSFIRDPLSFFKDIHNYVY